jgi:hypothetical protein
VTRIALPALLVMATVAAFVGAAGWNRSGEPELVIGLTERELPLARPSAAPGDDPGARLRIAYEYRHDPLDARNWLPETRLREIGFPLHVPVASPQAPETYDRVPPRVAWVVFEYDGPQWRDIARRRAVADTARPAPVLSSRLARGGPMLHGVLREVVPPLVSVPYAFRQVVAGLAATVESGAAEPRYEVELAVGSLGLPYVRALRSLR